MTSSLHSYSSHSNTVTSSSIATVVKRISPSVSKIWGPSKVTRDAVSRAEPGFRATGLSSIIAAPGVAAPR